MHLNLFIIISCFLKWTVTKNVLLLIADDAGLEIGALGNSVIKTPHIDNLASQSVVFQQAFTSVSSCSPSRSAILTGLPIHQNGMYGLHHDVHHFNSFENVQSISRILQAHKIRTGIIGKKHVGPEDVYPFDFAQTEENNPINSVGRNITHMKLLVREFLQQYDEKRQRDHYSGYFLYVAFHDPHRCGHTQPQFGELCNKYGNGEKGMGYIPDWSPTVYHPDQVLVPDWLPDTPATRADIAAQYTTLSRLDQGVGLVLNELKVRGDLADTLVIFSSDNGIPFPLGRTTLYQGGTHQPMFLMSPNHKDLHGSQINTHVSLLDIVPTVLDWFNIKFPKYHIFKKHGNVKLTGTSLLNYLSRGKPKDIEKAVFLSQNLHEVTMYYPMRSVRTVRFTLIHNLNYWAPFPIDQDGYLAPTFQDILNKTRKGLPLPWHISLQEYYMRPEWEMFDKKSDPEERFNVANKPSYSQVFYELSSLLMKWQNITHDPWICAPHAVLERDECRDLDN